MASGLEAGAAGTGAGHMVRAWDLPTRLFKWTLVVLVGFGYATYRSGQLNWHVWNGYALLVLVVFRLLWGLFGSSTARFSAWVTWPWDAARYGFGLLRGRAPAFLGHNPLGGWMIVALLTLISIQGVTGLFTVDDNGIVGGPFANLDFGDPTPVQRFMSRYHHLVYYVLVGFAMLHVAVNLAYVAIKKDPLISAMVTGEKPARAYADQSTMRPARHQHARALACLLLAAALVFGSVKLFGGALPTL